MMPQVSFHHLSLSKKKKPPNHCLLAIQNTLLNGSMIFPRLSVTSSITRVAETADVPRSLTGSELPPQPPFHLTHLRRDTDLMSRFYYWEKYERQVPFRTISDNQGPA